MKNIKKYLIFLSIFLTVNVIMSDKIYALKQVSTDIENIHFQPVKNEVGTWVDINVSTGFNDNEKLAVRIDYLSSSQVGIRVYNLLTLSATNQAILNVDNLDNLIWYVHRTGNNIYITYIEYSRTLTSVGSKAYIDLRSNTNEVEVYENYFLTTDITIQDMSYIRQSGAYKINKSDILYGNDLIHTTSNDGLTELNIIQSNVNLVVWKNTEYILNQDNFNILKDYIDKIYLLNNDLDNSNTDKDTTEQLESIDIYPIKYDTQNNTTDTLTINITSPRYNQNIFFPTAYKFYGEICNGNTCYWEETNQAIRIINDSYQDITNGLKITLDIEIRVTGYKRLKLGIKTLARDCNVKIKNENINNEYELDLNQVGIKYSYEKYFQTNENKFLLVNSKNDNNIFYRFYLKDKSTYDDDIFYFYYNKDSNIIENNNITTQSTYHYFNQTYFVSGGIELGSNSKYDLLIMFEPRFKTVDTVLEKNYILYMSDEVYWIESNTFDTFIFDINGNQTTIHPINHNEYIQDAMLALTGVDMDNFKDMIEQFRAKKDQWLEIFYAIYNPLPNIFKTIITLMYFFLHCYGIFLIFKD